MMLSGGFQESLIGLEAGDIESLYEHTAKAFLPLEGT